MQNKCIDYENGVDVFRLIHIVMEAICNSTK